MNKNISGNIKTIRELKNLTRDFVAAEMEMSTSGYGKIERGEIDLTISKLSKIAAIFDISFSDLLFFDRSLFFSTDNDKRAYTYNDIMQNNEVRSVFIDSRFK